jgi:23S rRNA-/tRNA-specific pseudouridylate synthase
MSKKDPDYRQIETTLRQVAEVITSDTVHLLHAAKLSFAHPITKELQTFTAEPHEKFSRVLELLNTLPNKENG